MKDGGWLSCVCVTAIPALARDPLNYVGPTPRPGTHLSTKAQGIPAKKKRSESCGASTDCRKWMSGANLHLDPEAPVSWTRQGGTELSELSAPLGASWVKVPQTHEIASSVFSAYAWRLLVPLSCAWMGASVPDCVQSPGSE